MRSKVLAMLCAAAAIAYVQRTLSIAEKDIAAEFDLSIKSVGVIFSSWFWGYAVMQIPSGWLTDKIGSRRAIVGYAVIWSLLTGCLGLANSFNQIIAIWFLMGCAQAGIFPCATKAIGAWFSIKGRAGASGLLASAMMIGGAVSPILTAYLLKTEFEWRGATYYFTWRDVWMIYAVPGLIWAACYWWIIPEDPVLAQPRKSVEEKTDGPSWVAVFTDMSMFLQWLRGLMFAAAKTFKGTFVPHCVVVFTSLAMFLLCLQMLLRAAAMTFMGTFFPRFMQVTRDATVDESANYVFWVLIGGMFGGLLGGICSDWVLRQTGNRWLSRQGVAIGGIGSCAVLFTIAHFIPNVHVAVTLMSAAAFAAAFGGVSGYAVAIDFGGSRVATVFSIMNMCGNIGAALFPLVMTTLVGEGENANWNNAAWLFIGLFFVDAICWVFLRPQGTLFKEEELSEELSVA